MKIIKVTGFRSPLEQFIFAFEWRGEEFYARWCDTNDLKDLYDEVSTKAKEMGYEKKIVSVGNVLFIPKEILTTCYEAVLEDKFVYEPLQCKFIIKVINKAKQILELRNPINDASMDDLSKKIAGTTLNDTHKMQKFLKKEIARAGKRKRNDSEEDDVTTDDNIKKDPDYVPYEKDISSSEESDEELYPQSNQPISRRPQEKPIVIQVKLVQSVVTPVPVPKKPLLNYIIRNTNSGKILPNGLPTYPRYMNAQTSHPVAKNSCMRNTVGQTPVQPICTPTKSDYPYSIQVAPIAPRRVVPSVKSTTYNSSSPTDQTEHYGAAPIIVYKSAFWVESKEDTLKAAEFAATVEVDQQQAYNNEVVKIAQGQNPFGPRSSNGLMKYLLSFGKLMSPPVDTSNIIPKQNPVSLEYEKRVRSPTQIIEQKSLNVPYEQLKRPEILTIKIGNKKPPVDKPPMNPRVFRAFWNKKIQQEQKTKELPPKKRYKPG